MPYVTIWIAVEAPQFVVVVVNSLGHRTVHSKGGLYGNVFHLDVSPPRRRFNMVRSIGNLV